MGKNLSDSEEVPEQILNDVITKEVDPSEIDVSIPNMDLLVEEIILSIDGVEKKGYGKYSRKK